MRDSTHMQDDVTQNLWAVQCVPCQRELPCSSLAYSTVLANTPPAVNIVEVHEKPQTNTSWLKNELVNYTSNM